MTYPTLPPAWPYPRWIAHRGAGKLAPENTQVAFELGHRHGFWMFECDAKLSADGQVFLLHDDDLDRTTSGRGPAAVQPWSALAELDAGAWLGPAHAGERLWTLRALAAWLQARQCLVNLEIKPCPGREAETGAKVAAQAQALWAAAKAPPLLSSFSEVALQAAQAAAPDLPRALLLDILPPDWLARAQALDAVAVVPKHVLLTGDVIGMAQEAGLRVLTYTVNDPERADALFAQGLDGLITDRVDLFEGQARAEAASFNRPVP